MILEIRGNETLVQAPRTTFYKQSGLQIYNVSLQDVGTYKIVVMLENSDLFESQSALDVYPTEG